MRSLTALLVALLLAATVFYWVAKMVIKSPALSAYTGWAMVVLAAAALIVAFVRDRRERRNGRREE